MEFHSQSPTMGSIWRSIFPSVPLGICFVILCISVLSLFSVSRYFVFFSVFSHKLSSFFYTYASIILIIRWIRGRCQSSYSAHCINYLGPLHTWVRAPWFRGDLPWQCHQQHCWVHVGDTTPHGHCISQHLQSGGQVRFPSIRHAFEQLLSRSSSSIITLLLKGTNYRTSISNHYFWAYS